MSKIKPSSKHVYCKTLDLRQAQNTLQLQLKHTLLAWSGYQGGNIQARVHNLSSWTKSLLSYKKQFPTKSRPSPVPSSCARNPANRSYTFTIPFLSHQHILTHTLLSLSTSLLLPSPPIYCFGGYLANNHLLTNTSANPTAATTPDHPATTSQLTGPV